MSTEQQLDWTDLDAAAVDVSARPGDGRRRGGRLGPPRHGDEPRARGVPAVPEAAPARPDGPDLARPRPLRPVLRAQQPDALHRSCTCPATGSPSRTSPTCASGARCTPGHPEHGHTPGVEVDHRARSARASATPSAWRWPPAASAACSTRTPRRAEPVRPHHLVHRLRRRHRGGRVGRGQLLAGHQRLGNLVAPLRRQPHLHRGRHRRSRSARTSARATRRTAGTSSGSTTARTCTDAATPALQAAARGRDRAPVVHRDAHDHRLARRRTSRTPARRTARARRRARSADQEGRSASTRTRPSTCRTTCSTTPARSSSAAAQAHAGLAAAATTPGRPANPERKALHDRLPSRTLPAGWEQALPTFRADAKGVATRKASGEVLSALAPRAARAVGRLGRPGRAATTPR